MVIKEEGQASSQPEEQTTSGKNTSENLPTVLDAPYFGRTARIVGSWESVDASGTPHEKNKRGELGKPLYNWYMNRVADDALARTAFPQSAADKRNTLQQVVSRAAKGNVNPDKFQVTDPKALSKHIKRVSEHLGAHVVGIAAVHPSMLYSGSRYPDDGTGATDAARGIKQGPDDMATKYPYAICLSTVWDYNMVQAHRHHIGDHSYHFSQSRLQLIYANLAAYIREMGYEAVQNRAQPMPTALAAGIGELGRNGMVITEKYGARIHLGDPILTNMPLVADKPIDIGVDDFCKVCRKCATTCPTNSITMDDKVVHNGVEKYKINWETCYRLRAYVMEFWEVCMSCVTVCPYTKPKVWWHQLTIGTLRRTPFALRPLLVRGLKFLDDKVWGTIPRKRVKWLTYDSGIKPVKKPRDQAVASVARSNGANGTNGTNGAHANGVITNGHSANGHGEAPDPSEKMGYYYPLKENTRRFEIMEERAKRSK